MTHTPPGNAPPSPEREFLYTPSHEWIAPTPSPPPSPDANNAGVKIGITHYGQEQLGEIVYVELPAAGRTIKKDEVLVVVESVKAASEITAPISGRIIAVNTALTPTPQLVNSSPYAQGWLCVIAPDTSDWQKQLLGHSAYTKLLAGA